MSTVDELRFADDDLLSEAYLYANMAHYGQERKGGGPYVDHPIRVALKVRSYVSTAAVAAALLHDVLEDTPHTLERFPKRVQELVERLTNHCDTKEAAIRNIAESRDREAMLIKIADRIDNLKDGFKTFGNKWFSGYLESSRLLLELTKPDCAEEELWGLFSWYLDVPERLGD
jgi:(p)ppGpp synthase/HD superfamily hydrolase